MREGSAEVGSADEAFVDGDAVYASAGTVVYLVKLNAAEAQLKTRRREALRSASRLN